MFSRKYKIPTVCDVYLNIYDKCNIGCHFCKFNQNVKTYTINKINYDEYKDKKILVCYSVDPYPIDYDEMIVPNIIKTLHNNNCSIVFLTRRADCLMKDIDMFFEYDYIGISISENCDKNSSYKLIERVFRRAKTLKIKTWISLEPVSSIEFAKEIIYIFKDKVDFIRVGKNDLDYNQKEWEKLKSQLNTLKIKNVFVKE